MRKAILIASLSSLFCVAFADQTNPEYRAWMKSMPPFVKAIRDAPDNVAAAGAATKMAETFDHVADYWKAKKTADAITFAETARDAARAIAAGTGDRAANLEKIQAQCGGCHEAHRGDSDPDRAVRGGKLPPGWSVRPDRGTADQINVTVAGDTYHFAMGTGATFYRSDWTKSGNYQFSARLTQAKAPTHPISYGLMIGGANLDGSGQTYSYFLVRNRGDYFIANRDGDQKPGPVVNWTAHPAIAPQGADGRQSNTLSIQVQGDDVIFSVNGTEVTRLPKSKVHTDGMYAFRIGHNIDIDVDQVNR